MKIRLIVPVIIFLFGVFLGLFSAYREISQSYFRVENDAISRAKAAGYFHSSEIEHHLEEGDIEVVNAQFGRLGTDLNLNTAILFDENNKAITATSFNLHGQYLKDTGYAECLPLFTQARDTKSGIVKLLKDKEAVMAIYPVILGALPGEIRRQRVGLFLMHYDLGYLKSAAYFDALNRSYQYIFILAGFCIVLWFMFDIFISRRIYKLIETSTLIAEGNFNKRVELKGKDELAELSKTFNKMADRIKLDAESLHSQFKQLIIIFDSFDAVVYVYDIDTKEIIFINKYGKDIDWGKAHWEAGKKAICSKECLIKDGILQSPCIYEFEYAAAGRWFQCIDRAIEWLDGRTVKLQIALDITARKWIEEELLKLHTAVEQSEKKLRDITSALGEGVFELDREGCLTFMNPEAERLLGWKEDELIAKNIHTAIHRWKADGTYYSEEECPVLKVLSSGKTYRIEDDVFTRKDGTTLPVAYISTPIIENGKVTASLTAFRDITERKNMEEALIRAKNLESLGFIAMGIAHDFNNLLTAILGNISLSKEYVKPEEEIFDMLSKSEDACMKAKDLTGRLLTFAKGGAFVKKIISIGMFLKESIELALSGFNVKCKFYLPDDLYAVEADERQMNQAIQNIVINSREAMPEGGVIRVSAENIIISKKDNLPLKDGNYIKIAIKDEGAGIPKEYLQKIFDPYFSTKQMGTRKGMGLGLSISYSIIKKHNGHIAVESSVGAGTTVYIYLPAFTPQPLTQPSPLRGEEKGEGGVV